MFDLILNTHTIIYFILNGAVTAGFMFFFLDKLYPRLYENKKIYFVSYCGVVIINYLISLLKFHLLNSIVSIISIILFVIFLYKVKKREAIIHSTAYTFGNIFGELLSIIIVSNILNENINNSINSGFSMYLFSLIHWIFLFINYKFFTTFYKNKSLTNIKRRELVFFVIITITEISIISYILSLIDYETSGIVAVVILSAFFCFNLYVEYLLDLANKSNELEINLELSKQQVTMQFKHYEDLMLKQVEAQSIIHDVKKHIMSIEMLAENQQIQQSKDYSSKLYDILDSIDFSYKCNNKMLTIIINEKMRDAKLADIKFTVNIEDIPLDMLNDLDITTIFANLLDNAFEENNNDIDFSYKNVNIHTNKWVKLTLQQKKNFILICVSNPIFTKHIVENGEFKTNKKGHNGLGLINVNNALQYYNGSLLTEIVDGNFVASITIPI